MQAVRLDDRAVIAVSGPEARAFLQGLITNDIEKLTPGTALYAAMLTPQGKILSDFFLIEGEGALLLDCALSGADALLARLTRYRLRAPVGLEMRTQLGVYAGLEGRPFARGVSFDDPRLAQLGQRTIGAKAEMPADTLPATAYHSHRLMLGVPEAEDFGSDKIFALDAGLDELHAVDFQKGCYVGQELTARMKHRATARKRLLPAMAKDENAALAPGAAILMGSQEIGEIVSSYGPRGFALVRLDRWSDPEAQCFAGKIPVALAKPAWLG